MFIQLLNLGTLVVCNTALSDMHQKDFFGVSVLDALRKKSMCPCDEREIYADGQSYRSV